MPIFQGLKLWKFEKKLAPEGTLSKYIWKVYTAKTHALKESSYQYFQLEVFSKFEPWVLVFLICFIFVGSGCVDIFKWFRPFQLEGQNTLIRGLVFETFA